MPVPQAIFNREKTPTHSAPIILETRIKDVATFEGVRDNQLVGYGLVVGLQGTGDDSNKSPLKESLASMLERLGVKVDSRVASGLKVKNTAVVMVTATLPPFARHGARIDVTVSAMGNAKSLLGGVLLPTPLMGADGETYVLAQGSVAVGGYFFGGNAKRQQMQTVIKGVPTNGRISNGGIVEKEIPFELAHQNSLRIMLRNPDFTTAKRISDTINKSEKKSVAHAVDPGTIVLDIKSQRNNIVTFLTRIEQLTVRPDQQARIVFDDRDGVIVINENVRIAPVAVAHGSLTIKITEQNTSSSSYGRSSYGGYGGGYGSGYGGWSQPPYNNNNKNTFVFGGAGSGAPSSPPSVGANPGANAGGTQTPSLTNRLTQTPQTLAGTSPWSKPSWSGGTTSVSNPVVRNTSIEVTQDDGPLNILAQEEQLGILQPSATLQDLVKAMNALGCGPRDLIIILQAIKQAGALQAQLEAM
jgi:flagellar P-ring protein precursor FlgI